MPPIKEQIENINESVANINKTTTDKGLQKLTPISSASLKSQPETKFPEPVPATKFDTASDLIGGAGDSLMNQLLAEQKKATEASQKGYLDTLSQYTEALSSQTGLQGFLVQEEGKAGIRPIAEQVAELEGTINSERLARANLKRRLESTGGGLKSGANAEYQNFANESLFRETNAVIQLGVQSGRLSVAKQSAERLANAYYEQEQNQLNARKELVDANKELFTQAEQRDFNLRYDSAKRELDRKEEELKLTQTTKIDALKMAQLNDAPREVIDAISSATTPEEVLKSGGQYASGDLLERTYKIIRNKTAGLEYDNLRKTLSGENTGLDNKLREKIGGFKETKETQSYLTLNENLGRLKDLYEEYGTYNPFDPDARKKINALKSQLEIDIAVAGGQGAISGQEADRYENIVGGGFQTGSMAISAIDEAMKTNNAKIRNNINFIESSIPGAKAFEPFKQFLDQEEAEKYIDEQLKTKKQTDEDTISSWLNNTSTRAVNI